MSAMTVFRWYYQIHRMHGHSVLRSMFLALQDARRPADF